MMTPKAMLLTGAAPAGGTPSADGLDALFAELLSRSGSAQAGAGALFPAFGKTASPAHAETGKPAANNSKHKTDPVDAALANLASAAAPHMAQPAGAVLPASVAAAAAPPTNVAAAAPAATAGKAAINPAMTAPNAATPAAAPKPANGKPVLPAAAMQTAAATAAAKSQPADPTAQTAAAQAVPGDDDQDEAQPTKADILQLFSNESLRNGAEQQATEAKALPVSFDAPAAKPAAKTDTASTQSAKAAKDSATAAQASVPDLDAAIKPRSDVAPAPQHALADAASNQSAQPAANANTASLARSDSAPAAANEAAAAQQQQPAQQTAPADHAVLQVAPQQAQAAAVQPNLAALAVSIAARSKDGEKHFDIRLDPPELGRVDVRLSVDSTGKAQAHLMADKPQTLDLLQRDRGSLERSIKDAGLDLSNNGLNFSLKGQERQGDSAPAPRGGSPLGIAAVNEDEAASKPTTKIDGLSLGRSHVDIRV